MGGLKIVSDEDATVGSCAQCAFWNKDSYTLVGLCEHPANNCREFPHTTRAGDGCWEFMREPACPASVGGAEEARDD